MRALFDRQRVTLGMVLVASAGYSHGATVEPAAPTDAAPAAAVATTCISPRHLGTMATRRRIVRVKPGELVTVQLVEFEAYLVRTAQSPPGSPFPWLAPQSPDPAGLTPLVACKRPIWIFSLPYRLYPFRAGAPGRYHLTAALNPAHHLPSLQSPLPPLHPISVTIVVAEKA
jgi:hypothetical protein